MYIEIPTGLALKDIMDSFKTNHGFPQCAGAANGRHIPIVAPQHCPAGYFWMTFHLAGNCKMTAVDFITVYV